MGRSGRKKKGWNRNRETETDIERLGRIKLVHGATTSAGHAIRVASVGSSFLQFGRTADRPTGRSGSNQLSGVRSEDCHLPLVFQLADSRVPGVPDKMMSLCHLLMLKPPDLRASSAAVVAVLVVVAKDV